MVSPKSRDGIGNLSSFPARTNDVPHFHREENANYSSPSGPSLQSMSPVSQSQQWGGIADLKSLLRHMIKGTSDPVKELPPVPDMPPILTDSTHRVCGAPPASLCTISQVSMDVIHLFPLSHASNFGHTAGQPSVTYGLLSKVPSPKEARDRAKKAKEKNKNMGVTKAAGAVDEGGERKKDKAMVVRVVCHGDKMELCHNKGEIHCGRVWVSRIYLL